MASAKTYRDEYLTQIAMPMGGIGAGSVCLTGIGAIHDFSIRNKPATTATQDGHKFTDAAFALLHVKGKKPVTKLCEGPIPTAWVYNRGLKAQGLREGGHEGLPRFGQCSFSAEYPFGTVKLKDKAVPLTVEVTGWNPFIPLDEKNSGIPCAILEYTLRNTSKSAVEFEFSYHLAHLTAPSKKMGTKATRTRAIPGGAMQFNVESPNAEAFGSGSVSIIGPGKGDIQNIPASGAPMSSDQRGYAGCPLFPKVKQSWFRGGWFDAITKIWRECSEGRFEETPATETDVEGRNGSSVMVAGKLKPGASVTIPVLITWYFPNCGYTAGAIQTSAPVGLAAGNATTPACAEGCDCAPPWKPWYSTQWTDAGHVAGYVQENYTSLRRRTTAFKDALFGSSLPPEAIDAIAANLAIIKSPTVLRQASGNLWAWEGCFADAGCCHGSCTHVWNYAQSLPHLFPGLERTLREGELQRSMDERGHVTFRAALPDGPANHGYHAAADGQLGGMMKVWREWQISNDRAWLEKMYPLAKQSLNFCRDHWDPDRTGLTVEPHHNTYDIEFWGPDGMCSSIYIGALTAMASMADAVGDADYAKDCADLAARGAAAMEKQLFNGEYYYQRVEWENLRDQSAMKRIAERPNDEDVKILKVEGPKYQYGKGVLSDGVIGAWMAELYGLGTPLKSKNVGRHLAAVFKYNFREDLSNHANCQRAGYALGDEAGLLLCSFPRGGKLTFPFPYAEEVWTGIEYQVASHLILHGQVTEGLAIVKAARGRYDGKIRNPFNEYECGSYYARAMASYALLQSLSGFRYSAVTKTLYLSPAVKAAKFRTFFSTATGFGVITVSGKAVGIEMLEGELTVDTLVLNGKKSKASVATKAGQSVKIAHS